MKGTVAITDARWYEQLRVLGLKEVNFWKPSARQRFVAPPFSPFLFKLPKPHYAICGFGYFAQWNPVPIWLAWEAFGLGNGCGSLEELELRIQEIRRRMGYEPGDRDSEIGCIQIVDPVFFTEDLWVPQPRDWPVHGQRPKGYDLNVGEGLRVWEQCLANAQRTAYRPASTRTVAELGARYGEPTLITPRLGQGTFRIAVTEAYGRACAITGEHSLPVLDAAHIMPFAKGGLHEPSNGLLLRADLHRLFDKGYLTVGADLRVRVSSKLRVEYQNGRTYYPMDGALIRLPSSEVAAPDRELLRWHSENLFAA
jgi:putative restriction endonuclease